MAEGFFDFVVNQENITIENVANGHPRRNFKIYKLEDYTEKLAAKHGMNG